MSIPPAKNQPPPPVKNQPPPQLAPRLRAAPAAELLALVQEHLRHFTMKEVRQILLNPYVTGEVLEELATARRLLTAYEVRAALTRHRRTPEPVAMRLTSGLYWRDLMEVCADVQIRPAVRRVAERYLIQRLDRLSVGEQTALARRAPPAVLSALLSSGQTRVITAVLTNSRLTEGVLVSLAARQATPRVLELLASDRRWGPRYEIRAALAKNTAAPFRVILDILPTLGREDLQAVAADEEHSSVIRNRAQDLLEAKTGHRD
jgi:hypothetical protein